ncbi:ATP-binding protein [sulfur-oxidizing endosymbiont of Gigantopelta aegis]|uniref:ATP-binding protein n=1 Tax=sulfur-oxidizing endosymbiont of Gigantopelta aegis TaxID=2794934 RepID=UPI0018DDB8EA|nr:ATP-binding protein [sulfur-oxidizing endosymbiont of Gigantopelta aegis]
MDFELWQLFVTGVGYLALLFVIAWVVDNKPGFSRLAHNPLTYSLSLGVYATSWSFYGSVGFAERQGYSFLTIYLGVTLAYLLSPILFSPILKLSKERQLTSLADLFAFRYQSQLVGIVVTLFMLMGTLPYIALQINAVTQSMQVLTHEATPMMIALGFCVTLILFAILFGARHSSAREKHEGLVVAIAFESIVKLFALLSVGIFALFGVFDGFSGLQQWLIENPHKQEELMRPILDGSWNSLIFISFTAALFLPRQFHMGITENFDSKSIQTASWAFPLLLLLINLPIPIILWAGQYMQTNTTADFYVLGITLHSEHNLLPLITFIGGLSAASAMMIVTTLALAAMVMNHFVLPLTFLHTISDETNIYKRLLQGRRIIIAIIIMAGFTFNLLLSGHQGLAQLGLISFVAVAQFLPGTIGLLFWHGANRKGLLAGLFTGTVIWAYTLILPLLFEQELFGQGLFGKYFMPLNNIILSDDKWGAITFWSLSANFILFIVVSLLTKASQAEMENAINCCSTSLTPPKGSMVLRSVAQIKTQLGEMLGNKMSAHEVERALNDLQMNQHDTHPLRLRQLREKIERNLSGLIGPLLAKVVINEQLTLDHDTRDIFAKSFRFMENKLEDSKTRLEGVAGELDDMRRYHRQVLQDLPLGVCSIGLNGEVLNWNKAIETLSGISAKQILGEKIQSLPSPLGELFYGFVHGDEQQLRKIQVKLDHSIRIFNLHKSSLITASAHSLHLNNEQHTTNTESNGIVLLVEDLSDLQELENRLAHSERLASIGRLAAGVAHEIGNPVTGIASVTQNLLAEDDSDYLQTHLAHHLEDILNQTRRITTIIQSLSSFSRSGNYLAPPKKPVPVKKCFDDAIHLVTLSHKAKHQAFDNQCSSRHIVSGDQQQLVQVFINLLNNACDASENNDTIIIRSSEEINQNYHDGETILIKVIDQGKGISEKNKKRLFEPFFTTKNAGDGMGLGLSIVYNIVHDHGGDY